MKAGNGSFGRTLLSELKVHLTPFSAAPQLHRLFFFPQMSQRQLSCYQVTWEDRKAWAVLLRSSRNCSLDRDFPSAWGRVDDDWILISGWTYPLCDPIIPAMYCIYTVLPVEMSALILKCNVIVWGFLRGIVKKKKEKAQKHKMFMDPRGGVLLTPMDSRMWRKWAIKSTKCFKYCWKSLIKPWIKMIE